jgi:dolichol-phosphate mannosyltransferase
MVPRSSAYVSLIVPTYNESMNIQELLCRAHRALEAVTTQFEIVVVDDRSADGTAELVLASAREIPNVRLIRRTGTRDLSASVMEGWTAAHGEILAVIDADLQHPPEKLTALLDALLRSNADVAVASRHVKGGGVTEWRLHRRAVSWCATVMASFLIPGVLRMVRDPMSGFFALRRRILASAALHATGYKILLEVLARAPYESLVEIPYVFEERKRGESKLGARQVWQYLRHVLRLSVETGEIQLLLRYAAVGAFGMVVDGAFTSLAAGQALPSLSVQALGFEMAVFSNFLLNDVWTFRGRVEHLAATQPVFYRFGRFQAVSVLSLMLNLGVSATLYQYFGASGVEASLAGIVVAGIANFFANSHLTWSLWQDEDVTLPGGTVERRRKIPLGLREKHWAAEDMR